MDASFNQRDVITDDRMGFNRFGLCLALTVATFPLSLFLVGIALGRSEFTSFCFCLGLACLVEVLPGLSLMRSQKLLNQPFLKFHQFAAERESARHAFPWMQRYGKPQSWVWRGWSVHYLSLLNPESQVPVLLLHGFGSS